VCESSLSLICPLRGSEKGREKEREREGARERGSEREREREREKKREREHERKNKPTISNSTSKYVLAKKKRTDFVDNALHTARNDEQQDVGSVAFVQYDVSLFVFHEVAVLEKDFAEIHLCLCMCIGDTVSWTLALSIYIYYVHTLSLSLYIYIMYTHSLSLYIYILCTHSLSLSIYIYIMSHTLSLSLYIYVVSHTLSLSLYI